MYQFTCPEVALQPEIFRVCKISSCHSTNVIVKQTITKTLKDSLVSEVEIKRMKCKRCGYSWRVYPEGVKEYSSRSKRLIFLGVVLYSAGLSYEKAAGFLNGMVGRDIEGFVTIWRDVQHISEKLRRKNIPVTRSRSTSMVVGIDGTYVRVKGKEQPLLVATNNSDGTTITVSLGNEWKKQELIEFFQQVAKTLGVPIKNLKVVTDDLIFYKQVTQKQHIPHQVCLAHLKKNTKNRLRQIKSKLPKEYAEKLFSLVNPPTKEGEMMLKELLKDKKLWKTGKRNNHWVRYRNTIGDLLSYWQYYTAYLTDPQLPMTNNRTEQAISRSKVRYKLTKGFKSKEGALNFFTLTQATGQHHFKTLASAC